ncbi:MAG TPA: carboxypeptidase-like regulatory domain-containing protein [Puia sp.]|nr:carboxypeptidase-like regulatory domain-containing protein [Puia sp.]
MNPLKKPLPAYILIVTAAMVLIAIACNKSSSTSTTNNSNPNNIPTEQIVTASLQGRVVDENGVPVEGAAVTSGTAGATTDVNGVFSFSGISMSSRFGYVQAVKAGYFTGSKSIITNGGASNYVNIQLIPQPAAASFPALTGGSIVIQTGDSVSFGDSAVVEASSKTAYTGTVSVYTKYLDPTDSLLYNQEPGDLRGVGTSGYETALESFGLADVILQDATGNALQIASGKTATLTWTIPTSLQGIAPATIPLWYFNDTTGRWIQQGSAVRLGNTYVGQVSHFTWWTCAQAVSTVNFNVTFKDQFGNPLAYAYYIIQSATMGTRGGFTNSSGFAQGLIAKSASLTIRIISPCGTLLGGVNVGPALSDQTLGTITVTTIGSLLTLTGTVVDCSNKPVDSGYVSTVIDGLNYKATVKNGVYTLAVNRCFAQPITVSLTPVDLTTQMQGAPLSLQEVVAGKDSVGQLTACQ